MKRWIGLALLLGTLTPFTGCSLLRGKPVEHIKGENTGGGMDPTQFVKAPAKVPISPNMAVGWTATQDTESGGQTNLTRYAVVGETADAWQIEHVNPGLTGLAASNPELEGLVIGLTVTKEDGTVTAAVVGKAGEHGRKIEILAAEPAPGEAVDEDVTIGLGTFPARKYSDEYQTRWVGKGGDLDGILLKLAPSQGDAYELSEMPEQGSAEVSGVKLETTHCVYSNGEQQWLTDNQLVATFFPAGAGRGTYKVQSEYYTTQISALGTDAKPTLDWGS